MVSEDLRNRSRRRRRGLVRARLRGICGLQDRLRRRYRRRQRELVSWQRSLRLAAAAAPRKKRRASKTAETASRTMKTARSGTVRILPGLEVSGAEVVLRLGSRRGRAGAMLRGPCGRRGTSQAPRRCLSLTLCGESGLRSRLRRKRIW